MGGGLGCTCVADLDDDVYRFECFGELAFGLGYVTGIPVYLGTLVAREGGVVGLFVGGEEGDVDVGC